MSIRDDIKTLFPGAKEHNGYMRIRCPYHKFGQERNPSLSILLEDRGSLKEGFAKCFACGWVGEFKTIAEDLGYEYIPQRDNSLAMTIEIPNISLDRPTYKPSVPYKFSNYLHSRGIDRETQKLFRTYEKESEQRVYMPVFARNGKFLFATSRSTQQKRFNIPKQISTSLAGIEEVDFLKPIAVCESQIDAMTFYSAGFCRAVSIIGATAIDLLNEIKGATGPFFLAFDSDEAGNKATERAIKLLGKYRCKTIDFGKYIDANNLWKELDFAADKFQDYIENNLRRTI